MADNQLPTQSPPETRRAQRARPFCRVVRPPLSNPRVRVSLRLCSLLTRGAESRRCSACSRRNPPIRDTVFAMLSAETDRFAQLEASIKTAKRRQHTSAASPNLPVRRGMRTGKLKTLREQAATIALEDSKIATKKAKRHEMELLQELQVEKNRLLAHEAAQAATSK